MLSDLPAELVTLVAGRLDARAQLRLAATCARLRGIVSGLPKHVVLCGPSTHSPWHWLRSNAAAKTVASLRAVRASAGLGRTWTGTSGWLARLEHLHTLSLRFCLASARITESIPVNLRHLCIHRMYGAGTFRTASIARLANLRTLDIMCAPTWNLVFVDELPPRLRCVRISAAPQLMVRDGIHGVAVVDFHAYDGIVFFASGGDMLADAPADFQVAPPPMNRITGCESLTLHADAPLWSLPDLLSEDLRRLDVSCTGLAWVDVARLTRLERLTLDLDHVDFSFSNVAHVAHVRVDARESMTCTDLYVPPPPGGTRQVRTRARPVWWCAPAVDSAVFAAPAQTQTPTARQLRRRRAAARRARRPRRPRQAHAPSSSSSSSSSSPSPSPPSSPGSD
jgi:hypothetical protein